MGATPANTEATGERGGDLLAPLRAAPGRTAIVCDIDGTLAPIVERPEDAAVPPRARAVLDALQGRYALVACISGRRALDARRIVGLETLTIAGNHGLELLDPHASHPVSAPGLESHARQVTAFAARTWTPELGGLGVSLEDKEAIQAFHYREAADQAAARAALDRVAAEAGSAGLAVHWGRKVLEIRPPVEFGKGLAVEMLLERAGADRALFGGDDRTDLDAFRALHGMIAGGRLAHALCVGVRSEEGPPEVLTEADLVVDGPEGFIELLECLSSPVAG